MKLYYQPGTCAIGIHVLLEEIGKPYELEKLDLQKGQQYEPGFTSINPKSKVPTLKRDDGSVLTEFPAIATWLARINPDKALLPGDAEGEARALEAMDYVVSTMHMQGFARMFRPMVFAPSETDHDKVKARGREIFGKGLELMSKALEGKEYVVGSFSVADAALFYVEFWAASIMKMPLPRN
jgi:glutathione S-transferase